MSPFNRLLCDLLPSNSAEYSLFPNVISDAVTTKRWFYTCRYLYVAITWQAQTASSDGLSTAYTHDESIIS